MKLTIKTNDLKRELLAASRIVQGRVTIEILSNVLLEAKRGELAITATDLDITVMTSVPAEIDREGAATVDAKRIAALVKGCNDEEITLELNDKNHLRGTSTSSTFSLATLPAEDFPSRPEVDEVDSFEFQVGMLKALASHTAHYISREADARFNISGVIIDVKESKTRVFATNGHALALATTEAFDGIGEMHSIVPPTVVSEIQRLEFTDDTVARIGRSENFFWMDVGPRSMVARVPDARTPDVLGVIANDLKEAIVVDRKRLLEAVATLRILDTRDGKSEGIILSADTGRLTLSRKGHGLGWIVQSLPADYSGGGVHIGMNLDYLSAALSSLECVSVTLHLKDEYSQFHVTPFDEYDLDVLNVVMPMRMESYRVAEDAA